MGYISEITTAIQGQFADEWWIAYGFDQERSEHNDLATQIIAFKEGINGLEDNFFDNLNLSILKGEYVQNVKFKTELQQLQSLIASLSPQFMAPDQEVSEILFVTTFKRAFSEPLKLAINFYIEFLNTVERKLKVSEKQFIFRYHDEMIQAIEEKRCEDRSNQYLKLLQANIRVAESDHYLSLEDGQLPQLLSLSRQLSTTLNFKPYSLTIKLKADFLKNKLTLRLKHGKESKRVYTVINSNEVEVTAAAFKDGSYDGILDYLDTHYELDNDWKSKIEIECEALRNKSLTDCLSLELHRQIKYYKDVVKLFPSSIERITNIRTEFNTRLKKARKHHDLFNVYAYSVSVNYAINNEFSLVCEDPSTTLEKAESLYRDILDIQLNTGIKNFFPQTKYLTFLLSQLKQINTEKKALESVQKSREIINKCEEVNSTYKNNIDWTKRNYNFVFQLPLKECLVTLKDSPIEEVFIFSSFLMPLPKLKYMEEFEQNKNEVFQLGASIIIFENLQSDITTLQVLKSEITSLQAKIADREVRTMEILGIFTALISFVAASLPTFKVIDTPLEAALFMLALATSFSSFVLLLLVSFRGIDKLREHRRIIYTGFIVAVIVWGILICLPLFGEPFRSLINLPKADSESDSIVSHKTTQIDIKLDSPTLALNLQAVINLKDSNNNVPDSLIRQAIKTDSTK